MKVITTREGEVLKVTEVKGKCSNLVAGMFKCLEEAEIDQELTLKLTNGKTVVRVSHSNGEVTATYTKEPALYFLRRAELVEKLGRELTRAKNRLNRLDTEEEGGW